jgi:AcrR family transcriptional regulator
MEKSPTRRQLQAKATRKHIYDTAMRLMGERGYDEVSIADIVKAAEVSTGSFYHYFKTKDHIFFEVYAQADEYFLEEVVPRLEGPPRERIVQYFDHYARFNVERGLEHARMIFNTHNKHFADKSRFMIQAFCAMMRDCAADGSLAVEWSPDEITEFLFTVARGLVFEWCINDGAFDLEKRMSQYIGHLARTVAR